MKKQWIAFGVSLSVVSALGGSGALGEVASPLKAGLFQSSPSKNADRQIAQQKAPPAISHNKHAKRNPSTFAEYQKLLARFRPVSRQDQFDYFQSEEVLANRRTIDEVFDEDLESRMRAEYAGKVLPHENVVNNPYRRARPYEMERYDNSRNELAYWTTKEVLKDQLRDLIRGADKDSSAMQVISAVKSVSGSDEESSAKKLSPEEKAARAHRVDMVAHEEEEEVIPTKLRAKLNVLKTQGNLLFTNPVVNTNLGLKAGSGDNVTVELNRNFKNLDLSSNLKYAVDNERLNLNVNKQITDTVALDLGSERFTGGKRNDAGKKRNDSAKVTYTLNF